MIPPSTVLCGRPDLDRGRTEAVMSAREMLDEQIARRGYLGNQQYRIAVLAVSHRSLQHFERWNPFVVDIIIPTAHMYTHHFFLSSDKLSYRLYFEESVGSLYIPSTLLLRGKY